MTLGYMSRRARRQRRRAPARLGQPLRADYIWARARMGVAGFGEFNFMPPNDRSSVIRDVTRALATGVPRLG